MIYPNGQRVLCYPARHVSGALAQCGALGYGGVRGARLNRFVSETYSKVLGAVPSGYGQRSYVMPVTAGGLVGFSGISFAPSAVGVLGMPGDGSASVSITIADADGQLVSSGAGSASFAITTDGSLLASLSAIGDASLTFSTTATVGALAWGEAATSMQVTTTLTSYAIGSMTGSTVDGSVLTVDAIAAGILAAALTSPIAANIKKVNDITVNGVGSAGNPWGP